MGGLRGAYERLLKLGYGLSILGAVPLIMENFYDALLPAAAALLPTWASTGGDRAAALLERVVTAGVLSLALALAVLIPNVEVRSRHPARQ